ncbi:MAG TPA: BlaI/MecI/CopY family transcriptional regulator [Verrucomicrobiae bacterium]|nr:BlaI/MecI/CopY family transcriptional regulator [Verrucomicrobiae bacterium]
MAKSRSELTEVEWTILKAVWDSEPRTAPTVQKALKKQTGWTYSTVRTVMDRMVVKGILKSKKLGKITWYRSALSRRRAQRSELLYALRHAFNGALAPMVQCLLDSSRLSEDELDKIEALLKEKREPKP